MLTDAQLITLIYAYYRRHYREEQAICVAKDATDILSYLNAHKNLDDYEKR